MSTIADVLDAVRRLLDSVVAVLATDTAKQAPAIARDLNVQPQLRDLTGRLQDALAGFETNLEPVRQAAVTADALVAIFGIVPAFVGALGDAAQDTGGYLASVGLSLAGAMDPAGRVGDLLNGVARKINVVVDAAEELLAFIDPTRFTDILKSLATLRKSLDVLKADPPVAKDAPPAGGPLLAAA